MLHEPLIRLVGVIPMISFGASSRLLSGVTGGGGGDVVPVVVAAAADTGSKLELSACRFSRPPPANHRGGSSSETAASPPLVSVNESPAMA